MIKDLNAGHETINLLQENISNMIFDISLGNIFLICLLRPKKKKSKNKQMETQQLKNSSTVKEAVNKMKRQPTEWEKLFAKDKSD